MNLIRKYFPVLIIFGLVILIAISNYKNSTYLSGWDNLHPEFNFLLNIKRSVFAVWQEYQGLGLLGGMGHAADLPRQIFLFLLSLVLPTSLIRYSFHFLMLFSGPLGVYFLLKDTILSRFIPEQKIKGALLGAVFYLLNLATLQMFYVPYEPFSVHFGFLPWLYWAYLNFLKKQDKKNLLWFVVINILSIPQGYVITFFFVYILSLIILTITYLIFNRVSVRKIFLCGVLILLINSFWLLPNLYFVFNKVNVNLDSKSNQMTTENNLLRNKKYGDIANTSILKGFWLDNVEIDKNGVSQFQMEIWRKYLDDSGIKSVGYISFILILIGIFFSYKKKINEALVFLPLGFISFTVLSSETPFFSFLDGLFYKIPLFSQIFRFPFTKFSILTALCFSIFFSLSYFVFESLIKKYLLRIILYILIFSLPLILLFPVFTGILFYPKVNADIPQDYFDAFNFFRKQNTYERIANFPQFTYWGWSFYQWNYSGSGFLWYGIEQPIIDRAFDVWSREDENYYHEITQAIYSENKDLFTQVLNKYNVSWVLIDDSVIGFSNNRQIYLDQLNRLIQGSSNINLTAVFGKLKIYKVENNNQFQNYVGLADNLPVVGPDYSWNNYDKGYEEYGDYITECQSSNDKCSFDLTQGKQNQNLNLKSGQILNNDSIQNENKNSLLAGGVTVKGDIHKEYQNGKKGCDYNIADIYIQKEICIHEVSDKLLNLIANANKTVAEIISNVNQMKDDKFQGRKLGEKIIKPINPEDKLINNPETTLLPDLLRNNFIKPIYAKNNIDDVKYSIPDVYYPFRSLFTGRKQEELEFGVKDNGGYISFTTTIPKDLVGYKLIIPAINKDEVTEYDKNDLSKTSEKFPQIFLDGELIPASSLGSTVDLPYIKEGNLEIRVPKISGYYSSDLHPFDFAQGKPINCDQFNKGEMDRQFINENGENLLRFTSIGSSNCIDFDLPLLTQRIGYLVTVENRNVEGKSLLFSVINKNSQRAEIETYLPAKILETTGLPITSNFIIPPMEQYGLGYTLHLDNISIGKVKTVNDLGRITVNPIPYRFLTSLKVIKNSNITQATSITDGFNVKHPNPSLYEININNETMKQLSNGTMIFSQSYDPGWHAYNILNTRYQILYTLLPFWFGSEIKDHVMVNNWENGWQINNEIMKQCSNIQCNIIIVYLPQYLEYIGFGLLLLIPVILWRHPKAFDKPHSGQGGNV